MPQLIEKNNVNPVQKPAPVRESKPVKLTIKRPFGRKVLRVLSAPFRAVGMKLLGKIYDRAGYEIIHLLFYAPNVATSVAVATNLEIFQILKAGPKTAQELARITNSHEPTLYRVLRGLAAVRFLHQKGKTFSLAPVGELLCKEHPHSLRALPLQWATAQLQCLPNLEAQVVEGPPDAFTRTTGQSYWEYLDTHPEDSAAFNEIMSQWTIFQLPAILKAYDFSKTKTVLDVGGGKGKLICEILKQNPHLRGIIYDRPALQREAEDSISKASLQDRCSMSPGSFLTSVPGGADTYILKHVLHDWDDQNALKILKNVRAAMQPGQRLLIIEGFVEHNHYGSDGFRKWLDINQLICIPGKLRTLEEMNDLLTQAGLEMRTLTPTSVTDLAILESFAV